MGVVKSSRYYVTELLYYVNRWKATVIFLIITICIKTQQMAIFLFLEWIHFGINWSNWPVPSNDNEIEQPGKLKDVWNLTLVAGSSMYSALPTVVLFT